MIFQNIPSQTQEPPIAGNRGGWTGGRNELCNDTLPGIQGMWTGGQQEAGNVTLTGHQEVWTGGPQEAGNVTPAMSSDLQGERDRLVARERALSGEVMELRNSLDDLQGENSRLGLRERELSTEVIHLRALVGNLQGENTRLSSNEVKLSQEAIDMLATAGDIKWLLTKSETETKRATDSLVETQRELRTANRTITSLTNANSRLDGEKDGLGRLNKEALKDLSNAHRREKAHKTKIAELKKKFLPMKDEAEGIWTDIEEASGSNTNVNTRKRSGDVICSPSGVKAAKTAKKAVMMRGSHGVAPPNLGFLSASDIKTLPQAISSTLTRKSTKICRSPPTQKNIKRVLNDRSQKKDDNDKKMDDMPPEQQASLEVMSILNELIMGFPIGSSESGTQPDKRAFDPISS
jgi:predicted nuclease with TOPRIM domain